MKRTVLVKCLFAVLLVAAALWGASCAVPLGPGYATLKQDVKLRFDAQASLVHVEAEYRLKNTGNRNLSFIEVRQPGRRFSVSNFAATWDGEGVADTPTDTPRNIRFNLARTWEKGAQHALRMAFDLRPSSNAVRDQPGFSPEGFFLPEGGWSPELVPSSSVLGFGGVPPDKWNLVVDVPKDFLVHASGRKPKRSSKGDRIEVRFEQTPDDLYPFAVAGRYAEARIQEGRTIYVWIRSSGSGATPDLEETGHGLAKQLEAFDSAFGRREKSPSPIWIVQCPAADHCATTNNAPFAHFFGDEAAAPSAELISSNTVIADLSSSSSNIAAVVGPSLAASWLGYGRNPGFYEQEAPLNALPLFAAAVGRESAAGAEFRAQVIRRALKDIPERAAPKSHESASVVRAKSLLFFYALHDRYGARVFNAAIQHMLEARQCRGFNLSDLIAAFEQETHQNVAEFVRLWMKHPGVPEEFRARHAQSAASASLKFKENEP